MLLNYWLHFISFEVLIFITIEICNMWISSSSHFVGFYSANIFFFCLLCVGTVGDPGFFQQVGQQFSLKMNDWMHDFRQFPTYKGHSRSQKMTWEDKEEPPKVLCGCPFLQKLLRKTVTFHWLQKEWRFDLSLVYVPGRIPRSRSLVRPGTLSFLSIQCDLLSLTSAPRCSHTVFTLSIWLF